VLAWLNDPNSLPVLEHAVDVLRIQTPWAGTTPNAQAFRQAAITYLQNQLVPEISAIAAPTSPYTHAALSERLANAGVLPMFGFPTRVRLLYTRWPTRGNPWPPEHGTVDRDLDIAISQFAPGSETVKDKAVHRACGVVEAYPLGNGDVGFNPGLLPPLPQPNTRIGLCGNCQAVVPGNALLPPPPGGQVPVPGNCPVCGQPRLVEIDAREPKGFFTDLAPDDFEGAFEWTPRSTRPTLSIGTLANNPTPVANAIVDGLPGTNVISVNDAGGQGGFDFQDVEVDAWGRRQYRPIPGAYAVVSQATNHLRPVGQQQRIALLSRRRTDVLLVDMGQWPAAVFADPQSPVGRAAWYSLAFFLRVAAAAELDVDTLELDAGFRTSGQPGSPFAQAFLSDKLENGAGYCQWLAEVDPFTHQHRFQLLLRQADPNHPGSIAQRWLAPGHAHECDTSCNVCLRDFYNLPYHGLLDWRLALDMTRILSTTQVTVDLTTAWPGAPNPWERLTVGDAAGPGIVPRILARLGFGPPQPFGSLRGYVHQNTQRRLLLIESHRLWTAQHAHYTAAHTAARQQFPNHTDVRMVNPFLVIRRPAEYV
jgi:hypothetical protein